MKDYTFKPEFEKKLGTDKEAFIENLKDQGRFSKELCDRFNKLTNFKQFTCDGFLWHLSNECNFEEWDIHKESLFDQERGHEFWEEVSKR